MQNNCSKEEATCAGFWVRLAAYGIDSLIVGFVLLFVRLFLSGILSLTEGTVLGRNILFEYSVKDIVLYILHAMYFILFIYGTGTTPGKRLMNLRVVSADGEKLSFMDVLYRETVGRYLCGMTIGAGYIFAGVDKEKRGLHDMLCDTRVIYGRRVKVYPVYQGACVPRQVTPEEGTEHPQAPSDAPAPHLPQEEVQPDAQPRQMYGDIAPREPQGPYRMVSPEEEKRERDS